MYPLISTLPSLEELRLGGCGVGLLQQLCDLLDRKEVLVPIFRRVELSFHADLQPWNAPYTAPKYTSYDAEIGEKLKADCEAVGIQLVIRLRRRAD